MLNNPHTVPTPDDLFDIYMKDLSGPELKIIMSVVRKTIGFCKEWDRISLSQFQQMTNLTKDTIATTIPLLDEHFLNIKTICCECKADIVNYPFNRIMKIYKCPNCGTKESPNKEYSLIMSEELKTHLTKIKGSRKNGLGSRKNGLLGSRKNGLGVVENLDTQETIYKKQEEETKKKKEYVSSTYSDKLIQSDDEIPTTPSNSEQYDEEKFTLGKTIFQQEHNSQFFVQGALTSVQTQKIFYKIIEYTEDRIREAVKKQSSGRDKSNERYLIADVLKELEKEPIVKEHIFPPVDPAQESYTRLISMPVWMDIGSFKSNGKIRPLMWNDVMRFGKMADEILTKYPDMEEFSRKAYPCAVDDIREIYEYAKNNPPEETIHEYTRKDTLISEDV